MWTYHYNPISLLNKPKILRHTGKVQSHTNASYWQVKFLLLTARRVCVGMIYYTRILLNKFVQRKTTRELVNQGYNTRTIAWTDNASVCGLRSGVMSMSLKNFTLFLKQKNKYI